MKKIYAIAATAILASGCTSTLKEINNGLSAVNNELSRANGAAMVRPVPRSGDGALLSASQQAKLNSGLLQKNPDTNINSAIAEASPVISAFIGLNSCIAGYDGSVLNRYAAPGVNYSRGAYTGAPLPQMRYHDKSSCATVLRFQDWKMPARNALRFEVSYISDASGEVVKRNHEVVKQPNGEWLFTR